MANCPNCGAAVDAQDEFCEQCGTALGGGGPASQGQHDQHGQPQQGQGQGQPPQGQGQPPQGQGQPPQGQGQPPQGGGQGQPQGPPQGRGQGQPQGQPPQGQGQGQPQGQPPQGRGHGQPQGQQPPPQGHGQPRHPPQGRQDDTIAGYSRRKVLMAGGGAAVLLGGGALAFTMMGGASGPKGVAKSYINALDSGNNEKARSLAVEGSPASDVGMFQSAVFGTADISISSTKILSETEDTAEVQVTATVSSALGEDTTEFLVELRNTESGWKVYDMN